MGSFNINVGLNKANYVTSKSCTLEVTVIIDEEIYIIVGQHTAQKNVTVIILRSPEPVRWGEVI
jgi:hypothetical protein